LGCRIYPKIRIESEANAVNYIVLQFLASRFDLVMKLAEEEEEEEE
jgi:hypothetical protein